MNEWRPPEPDDILRSAAEQRHFMTGTAIPPLGAGLGYSRAVHDQVLARRAEIDWLEIAADQFRPLTSERMAELVVLRQHFVCVPHGRRLALAGPRSLDERYLSDVCAVAEAVSAPWLSGGLGRTRDGRPRARLAPVPRTRQAAAAIARKAREVQSRAARPFLLEYPSGDPTCARELTEAQFLCEVLYRSDCWLRLDVNHLCANSLSLRRDPQEFLDQIPLERVLQVQMTGARRVKGVPARGPDALVPEAVWELADYVISRASVRGVLVERASARPGDVGDLLGDVRRARGILGPSDEPWSRRLAARA